MREEGQREALRMAEADERKMKRSWSWRALAGRKKKKEERERPEALCPLARSQLRMEGDLGVRIYDHPFFRRGPFP